MRISLNWLSEYIDIPFTPSELADKLTMLGIEVEAIEDPAARLNKIIVGEVLEVTAHPNADKLRLTRVTIGNGEPLRIVCGAPNVRTGLKVAVATIGADLGEGFVIKKSKIRGEVSEGMLCSEKELGFSEDHAGIWELKNDLAVGTPLAEALDKNDVVFEIGITPNRADCLSHIGIAREIHAITGAKLRSPEVKYATTGGAVAKEVTVTLPQPDLCPRYVAKLVKNVRVKPSPDWLKRKLEAVGLRPINNVVDVTNFVLMECGHPLHAFDFDQVESGRIEVRTAGGFAPEYVTLDGKLRKMPAEALLITDGNKPLGIAGIMGGENSEIRETTKNVLIESAYFNPTSIRRAAKQLGLSTDASYRFERGTNHDVLPAAAERAAALIAELGEGEIVEGTIDVYPIQIPRRTFRFRPERATRLLGMPVVVQDLKRIFDLLQIDVEESKPGEWTLTAPSFRIDLEREEDAIEEIARIVGYENIPLSEFEHAPLTGGRDALRPREFDELVRNTLLALGVTECVSTPLVSRKEAERFDPSPVEVINPLNIEMNRMRTSLAINLLEAAGRNERFGAEGQRLFEMGNVFGYAERGGLLGKVAERGEIGVMLSGVQELKSPYNTQPLRADIFLLKGLVENLIARTGVTDVVVEPSEKQEKWKMAEAFLDRGQTLVASIGGTPVGIFGRLSAESQKSSDLRSETYLALLDRDSLYSFAKQARLQPKQAKPLAKYPAVERDIAIVLDQNVSARSVELAIAAGAPKDLLKSVRTFDEFQSAEMKAAGERSLAFRMVFRAVDRTLEEREVDEAINMILKRLESELHARLRA